MLHPLDYLVIGLYAALTLGLGFYLGRGMHSGREYFLAGRSLPWWIVGVSLVATDIGGPDIIGVGGAAYQHGLAVANFEWIGCVPAMIVAAFVFVPYFYRAEIYTIPEFMERRYNPAVRAVLALCWLLFMASNLGVMLLASAQMSVEVLDLDFAGHRILGFDLAGAEYTAAIVAIALLAGAYTCAGGLAAVAYTDFIQGIVMILGCLIVLIAGVIKLGGPTAALARIELNEQVQRENDIEELRRVAAISLLRKEQEPEYEQTYEEAVAELERLEALGDETQHTRLILPVDTASPFPWTGILFGLALVLSPAYWIGNQAIVQRSLGARSEFEAKASYVCGALLKNLIPVVIALPGLIAYGMVPQLDKADHAFPMLVNTLLPIGLRGLFLAAFLAALMSSVDSYLNAAATIFTNDLFVRFVRPTATDKTILRLGRATTAVLTVWAVGFALWLTNLEGTGIYTIFQTLMAFFQGPALAILLLGMFWKRANGRGAFLGLVLGIATSVTLFALNQPPVYEALGADTPLFQIADPFLYFSVWAFLVAVVVTVGVSLLTRPEPAERIAPLMYHQVRRS